VPNLIGGALGRTFGDRKPGEVNGETETSTESATDRISAIAGQGLAALKTQAAHDAAAAKAAADEAAAKTAAEAERVKEAVEKAAAVTATKAATVGAKATPSEANVKQWAKWMADQLKQVPDIGVYGQLRLTDLASRGPVAARGLWTTAKAALSQDYGNVTVDDLLTEFKGLQR